MRKINKIAQSNLGTGCIATIASVYPTYHPKPQPQQFTHFCTAMPQIPRWLQWGTPHFCPQNYPLPWTDSQTQLPASSLDPSDVPSQTASISDQPFCHNALDKQTRQPHRPTDGWRECLMTIGHFRSIESDDTT